MLAMWWATSSFTAYSYSYLCSLFSNVDIAKNKTTNSIFFPIHLRIRQTNTYSFDHENGKTTERSLENTISKDVWLIKKTKKKCQHSYGQNRDQRALLVWYMNERTIEQTNPKNQKTFFYFLKFANIFFVSLFHIVELNAMQISLLVWVDITSISRIANARWLMMGYINICVQQVAMNCEGELPWPSIYCTELNWIKWHSMKEEKTKITHMPNVEK